MKRGHVPLRTCIACGVKTEKGELIRVVRTPAEQIEVDTTGKKPGRGVYLCYRESCWDRALRKGRLAHSLRAPLAPEDRLVLQEFALHVAGKSSQE